MKKNIDFTTEKLIQLGFAASPHGIRGAASLVLENLDDSVLEKGMSVLLKPSNFKSTHKSTLKNEGEVFTISDISFGNKVICSFKEVNDRNRLEEILPFEIYVSRDQFPEADDDEYFITDLIGLEVLDHESREKIGKVARYFDNGAQIVLTLNLFGKYVDLPFIDNFFPEVDVENKYITLISPEEV